MLTKRVILANNSRLLREMFRSVIERAADLEVVHEVSRPEDLLPAIQRFCPDWVIVSLPLPQELQDLISTFLQVDSSVRFIFLSPDQQTIQWKQNLISDVDLSNASVRQFIYLLQAKPQEIG